MMRTLAGLCIGLLLSAAHLHAQVSVAGSTGADGSYATLAAAFTTINGAAQTGNAISITITGTTAEPATGASLLAGTWMSLLVQPSGAATVQGTMNAGLPLINLNGADNVTFDGLNSGGNSLTFINSTVSFNAGTSTIRFINDAQNNLITRCSIQGCSTMSGASDGGTVLFSTALVGGTGNDNNTISFCDIGPVGTQLPTKAVYSAGSNSSPAGYNTGVQLLNNNIHDFFGVGVPSNGVYVGGGTADMTISNNRFYQTAPRTQTIGALHCPIQLASANNNNVSVSGNIIGYANAAGTGLYEFDGANTNAKLIGIYVSTAGTGCNVSGNVITAIDIGGVVGGTGATGAFVGISVAGGQVTVGVPTGNTIGSLTASNAIVVNSANFNSFEVFGISATTTQPVNVSNNNVGGINANNTSTGALTFMGMRLSSIATSTHTINHNTVGSQAAPLVNACTVVGSRALGICSQVGITSATGNIVSDLSLNAVTTGTGTSASMIGLLVDNTSASTLPSLVVQNSVCRFMHNAFDGAVQICGILFAGSLSVTANVDANLVHTLKMWNDDGSVIGISAFAGTATYSNNMVRLGSNSVLEGYAIQGLLHQAGHATMLHNSVYIASMTQFGFGGTYALYSVPTTGTRIYRNNILFSAATGNSGGDIVIRVAVVDAGLVSNNNVLRYTGTGGGTGRVNTTSYISLANWQAATGLDGASMSTDPHFTAPTATLPNLHITAPSPIETAGAVPSVTNDFDGQIRSTLTPVDIGADAGNYSGASITVHVMLQGSFDPAVGYMSDALRAAGLIPLTEPYTAMGYTYVGSIGGTISPALLAYSSTLSIHDWVIVELRSSSDPAVIIASRPALVRRNGQVCELDGTAPLTFNAPPGNYYVAVRHRNHLGVMTATPIAYIDDDAAIYFPVTSYPTYGTEAQATTTGQPPWRALWCGDVTFDGSVKYTGANNDRDPILVAIGGTVPTNTVSGYLPADVNLDGVVKYTGASNDRDPILVNIGGTVPTNTRVEQIP